MRITRLDGPLRPYIAEDLRDRACKHHERAGEGAASGPLILCADTSLDVLAYLRGLLKEAGHRVVTSQNLYDGLILLKTMRPSVVVIGEGLQAMHGTSSAYGGHRRVPPRGLIVLPPSFLLHHAAEAGSRLLAEIRAILDAV